MPETKTEAVWLYTEGNCASQSEFAEKALRFYCGHVRTRDDQCCRSSILSDVSQFRREA